MEIRSRTDFSRKFLFSFFFSFASIFVPGTKSSEKFGRNVLISGRKEFLVTHCASIFCFLARLNDSDYREVSSFLSIIPLGIGSR